MKLFYFLFYYLSIFIFDDLLNSIYKITMLKKYTLINSDFYTLPKTLLRLTNGVKIPF